MTAVYSVSNVDVKLCVCMVGLPARGKTYIAEKIRRYLTWLSIPTRTFNVGNYRRKTHGGLCDASFFDPKNEAGNIARMEAARHAVNDILAWFSEGGVVGVLDATNSTSARRKMLSNELSAAGVEVMFVESVCDNEQIIQNNIADVKVNSPDYANSDAETAIRDFNERVKHYESTYETIEDKDMTYCKLIDVGSSIIINQIKAYLQSRIVYYLMNVHARPRHIWLSRHGESQYNLWGKIGGDAHLSVRGREYARRLPEVVKQSVGDLDLKVWTSTLQRTIETAAGLSYKKFEWKALDELDAGVCDGMTYEEIEEKYPEDMASRDHDKYNYRYRGGESYRDVVIRLEPIIMELERQENVLIVCHQAILRCIYGYFHNLNQEDLPYVNIPLHTVIKLTPRPYSTEEERIKVDVPAVSTQRPRPSKKASVSDK